MDPARGNPEETGARNQAAEPNRLVREKSPYLLQHAYNPVDWYPWSEEAFAKAQAENKPIFLSIGYSTCHWCHVMAHESFEDPQIAKLLNDVFVCIKVDREERPDLDQVYMTAAHLLTGRGGWPLTIIMTPDKKPFLAASYIPKESRYGMTGLLDLIPRIHKAWVSQREALEEAGDQVLENIRRAASTAEREELGVQTLEKAYNTLLQSFDGLHGGFGSSPKFPTPHNLSFLLRYGKRADAEPVYAMVAKTLHVMRQGGIYDHIGFGFHRYSTDAEWFVPHFEKMLYDQALLVVAYVEAYLALGDEAFRRTAEETITYVLRDMTDPAGGFYAAEDADSEGVEGKFYLWTKDEIRDVLGEEDGGRFSAVFDVKEVGNFRVEATGEKTGSNILRMRRSPAARAADLGMSEDELRRFVESARRKLFAAREKRVRPHKDDKILTDWNGLMIAALAKAARAFGSVEYREAAERAASFLLSRLRRPDGRLLHRYRDGEAGITATADDYAFLIWGLWELYETTFDVGYLTTALLLQNDMLAHYQDAENGGFYTTAADEIDLPVRQKEVYDGAVPSANSVAVTNLLVLGRMTAHLEFEEAAYRALQVFSGTISSMPAAYTFFLTAVDFIAGPNYEVIITGVPGAGDTDAMIGAIRSRFIPNAVILFRPAGGEPPPIASVAPFAQDAVPLEGRATAYVCINYACDIPTTDADEMLDLLTLPKPPEPFV
ncbi:thioredoxin domain-containing protein [Methanoculleus sp. FWC-SCC1]|uniref:Thioredoxin domain-containing protein n=1 Tax=Methanoculleus frigidifontis TaxID=2584085 RepID=A0ABT8MD60_9EURY|nr:thioredoxin domain-containing protein [Methanoculleus sp. FWC-SCC1]MDN7025887.1 thioredoxin domain-containing protein [Methanoculleus sp. FWC-SCC1]